MEAQIVKKQTKETINIKEALKFGWETTVENFIFLLGVVLIVYIWQFSSSYFLESLNTHILVIIALNIAFYIISTLLSLGLIKISLEFVNKRKPNLDTLVSGKDHIKNKIIADILYFLMVLVGTIFLIIPGIYLAIKYNFYGQFIVDKNMGPLEALKASAKITKGIKMSLFVLFIIITAINILGALFFAIGLLFTVPMTALTHVYIYKKLSSQ